MAFICKRTGGIGMTDISIEFEATDEDFESELELKRFSECYRIASYDDKKVIWAVLNKYVPFINEI